MVDKKGILKDKILSKAVSSVHKSGEFIGSAINRLTETQIYNLISEKLGIDWFFDKIVNVDTFKIRRQVNCPHARLQGTTCKEPFDPSVTEGLLATRSGGHPSAKGAVLKGLREMAKIDRGDIDKSSGNVILLLVLQITEGVQMRVTVKGQVTIPQDIRKKMGITPGCEIIFKEDKGRVYLVKARRRERITSHFRKLRGIATVKMTTDEIMALTREKK